MINKVRTAIFLSAFAVVGSVTSALGADWVVIPFVEVKETYVDDVDLDAALAQSDFVTQTTVGASVVTVGPRVNLNLLYGLTHLFYPGLEGDKDEFRHNLTADLRTELARDFLFFDAQAGMTQQFIDRRDAFTSVDAARTLNRATVSIVSASPYTQNKVGGNFAVLTNRYTYSYLRAARNADFDLNNLGEVRTQFHEGLISLNSGTRFTKFTWLFENQYREVVTTNGQDNKIFASTLLSDYQLNRQIAFIGLFGYSKRNADFGPANFSGLIWRFGGRLTPGPRTELEGTYGKDFIGKTFDFTGSYRITPNILAEARYNDRHQTLNEFVLDDFQNGVNNGAGVQQDALGDAFVRNKEYRVSIVGVRGRSTITFSAIHRIITSEDVTAAFVRDSFGVIWERTLSPRLTFSASADLLKDKFSLDSEAEVFIGYAGRFDYIISRSITASLDYAHTRRRQLIFNYVPRKSNLISVAIRVAI